MKKPLDPSLLLKAPRTLIRSVRLLAMVGVLALVSSGELDWPIILVCLGLFLFGIQVERFPRLDWFFSKAQPYLATLVFFLAVADFFYLSKSFLLVVAHFLMSIQGLRLLSLGGLRDNLGSVLLSSMMMLSAATLAVEWTFFVMLFAFLPSAIWTVILLNLAYENVETMEKGIKQTQFSGEGQMAWGSFLKEKTGNWKKMIPALRQSTGVAFLVSALVCAAVFVSFPRLNFRGFKGRFLQPVHKTGFTNQVNLNKSGRIYEDSSIVMRVEVSPEDRENWTGYMRGRTLSTFNGSVWQSLQAPEEQIFHNRRGEIILPGENLNRRKILKQKIYLESLDSPLLFGHFKPVKIKIDRPFLFWGEDGSVSRRYGDAWRVHYEVESVVDEKLPSKMRPFKKSQQQQPLKDFDNKTDFLEGLDKNKWIPLINQIVGGAADRMERARRIENYFKDNFSYSLDLGKKEKGHPLDRFLFDTQRGHCEYFASSMCLMLRVAGIPSRMVTGFLSHEWNDRGGYYVVRMSDAHAWVEAYIEPHGWVNFDPSPREVSGVRLGQNWLNRVIYAMDFLNLQWNRYILSYDFEKQVDIVRSVSRQGQNVSFGLNRWSLELGKAFKWWGGRNRAGINSEVHTPSPIPAGLVIFAFVVMMGGMIWFLARFIGKKRSKQVWFYSKLIGYLEKKGGPKQSGMTLNEFAENIRQHIRDVQGPVEYLIRQYYRIRFGSPEILPHQDQNQIRQALQQLK